MNLWRTQFIHSRVTFPNKHPVQLCSCPYNSRLLLLLTARQDPQQLFLIIILGPHPRPHIAVLDSYTVSPILMICLWTLLIVPALYILPDILNLSNLHGSDSLIHSSLEPPVISGKNVHCILTRPAPSSLHI